MYIFLKLLLIFTVFLTLLEVLKNSTDVGNAFCGNVFLICGNPSVLNRLTFQLNWENRLYTKIDSQNRFSIKVDFENQLLKIIDFGEGIFDFFRIQRIRWNSMFISSIF